jgi:dipeptidyl aminopeptidase/acylaminoacyl peptidase
MTHAPTAVRRALTGCAAAALLVTLAAASGQPPPPPPSAQPPAEQPAQMPPSDLQSGASEQAPAAAPPAAAQPPVAPPPVTAPAVQPSASEPPVSQPPAAPAPVVQQPAVPEPAVQPSVVPPPLLQRLERGNLVFDNIPPPDAALSARLARYLQSREASLVDWLPDGSLLISTRFGDTEQLHRLASPLGAREQLTFYPEPVNFARAAPRGGGFVYLRDQGGDENSQVYYQAADGAVRQLTQGAFIHGNPVWAHDGKRVAFYGNDRDGVSYDVYVVDVTSGAAPQLVVGGQQDAWYPLAWSADDVRLLVWRYVSISESYLYIANLSTGELTPLDTSGRKIGIRDAKFAPDGRSVYVLSDEDSEFIHLRLIDPVTHQVRRITPDAGWDVEAFDVSPDGRYIAYVLNQDGRSRLMVLDTATHADVPAPGLPEGVITRVVFERSGLRFGLSLASAQSPGDVYTYDLEHQRLERWTRSEPGPVDVRTFTSPELIRYPTWDRVAGHQRLLSAYVYRPRTAARCPVVIDIHGGPESQFRPGWDPFIQFLVNELGYAVIAPNVRGSSGYGRSFLALDNGELREDAVRDIGSLLVWIGAQRAFDRERVAVMGASYGGYMTLASLVHYRERLRGGIDVVGISNFVTFLRNTSAYRRDLRRAEYGDERDPRMREFLERISPLTNASRIRKPLLVVEGLNDPRVPASESEQLVWRVRAGGGEVWHLIAKDEGHGFRRKANRDVYLETAAMFLRKLSQ